MGGLQKCVCVWVGWGGCTPQGGGGGRGYKITPKWGIKPPPTPVLAIFDPWGGFIPPYGGVGLSPHRGGFIPAKGWFYPPKGVVLSPH